MSSVDSTTTEHNVSGDLQSSTVRLDASESSNLGETFVDVVEDTLDEHVVTAQNITAFSDSGGDASELVGNLKTPQNSPEKGIGAPLPLVIIKIDLEVIDEEQADMNLDNKNNSEED